MEYLTSVVLSGLTYDLLKEGLRIKADTLKKKIRGWVFTEDELEVLATHINRIPNIEDLNESAIARNLDKDPIIQNILSNSKQVILENTINQSHSGTGHMAGRDINITNEK